MWGVEPVADLLGGRRAAEPMLAGGIEQRSDRGDVVRPGLPEQEAVVLRLFRC
jgi:hypothetical protein